MFHKELQYCVYYHITYKKKNIKNTALSEQFQNLIKKIVDRGKIDISPPNKHIHDHSRDWYRHVNKRCSVKLVLWAHTKKTTVQPQYNQNSNAYKYKSDL